MSRTRWTRTMLSAAFAALTAMAHPDPVLAQRARTVADFNGDGIDDLAVAAPGANGGRGTVSIFLGVQGVGFQSTTPDLERSGILTGENYGAAMAAADFNRNGRFELVVGAPLWAEGRGRVEIIQFVSSGSGALVPVGLSFNQDTAGVLGIAEDGDQFGGALTTGDFDADGYPDLAVGVRGESIGNHMSAGAVNVLYGGAHGISADDGQIWHQDSAGIPNSAEAQDGFGFSLAVGDFNGDRRDDLAIGVPFESTTHDEIGVVQVIFGAAGGLSGTGAQLVAYPAGIPEIVANFGFALGAGDFNSDGFSDLAIGAPRAHLGRGHIAGAVMVKYGSADGLSTLNIRRQIADGPEHADMFGYALAVGDFDGDGFDDLAVGVPFEDLGTIGNAGVVNVYYGSDGFLRREQFWNQDSDGVEDEAEPGDHFGESLMAADFTGDGITDLAIGIPLQDLGSVVDAGATAVLVGTRTGLSSAVNHVLGARTPRARALFGAGHTTLIVNTPY